MRKTKWHKFVILLLIAGVFAFAGCSRHHERHSGGHKSERVLSYVSDELDLSDSQRAQLKETVSSMEQSREEMHNDSSLKEAFIKELSKERLDTARLDSLVMGHMDKIEDLLKGHVSDIVELHASLTTEQRERLVDVMQKRGGITHNIAGRSMHSIK